MSRGIPVYENVHRREVYSVKANSITAKLLTTISTCKELVVNSHCKKKNPRIFPRLSGDVLNYSRVFQNFETLIYLFQSFLAEPPTDVLRNPEWKNAAVYGCLKHVLLLSVTLFKLSCLDEEGTLRLYAVTLT